MQCKTLIVDAPTAFVCISVTAGEDGWRGQKSRPAINGIALCRYTQDGRLSIDNNAAERRLRDQAIGRKNWLFLGNGEAGACAGCGAVHDHCGGEAASA